MRLEWPQSENRMNAHHRHGTVAIRTDLLDIVQGTTACSMISSGQVFDPVTLRPTWKENLYTLLVVLVVLGAILS